MGCPTRFTALDEDVCVELLAAYGPGIGRVVFSIDALPAAQPVNYTFSHGEVVFRTRNGAKLAAAVRHAVVGFEVDEIDLVARTGWSVFGIGRAYEIHDQARLSQLASTTPDPWAPGHDAHTIAIPMARITGRRISREPASSGT